MSIPTSVFMYTISQTNVADLRRETKFKGAPGGNLSLRIEFGNRNGKGKLNEIHCSCCPGVYSSIHFHDETFVEFYIQSIFYSVFNIS